MRASDAAGVQALRVLVDGRRYRSTWRRELLRTFTFRRVWKGAKRLKPGRHTISVQAFDAQGGVGRASVTFTKVAAPTPWRGHKHR